MATMNTHEIASRIARKIAQWLYGIDSLRSFTAAHSIAGIIATELDKELKPLVEERNRLTDQLAVTQIGREACAYCRGEIGVILTHVSERVAHETLEAHLRAQLAELKPALDRIEHETCGQCNYMRSIAAPCKCGQFSVKGTNDHLRAQLAEAQELLKAARAGQPLGPIIGAQTMLNHDSEIRHLKAQLASEQEKVRKAKEALLNLIRRCTTCGGLTGTYRATAWGAQDATEQKCHICSEARATLRELEGEK